LKSHFIVVVAAITITISIN